MLVYPDTNLAKIEGHGNKSKFRVTEDETCFSFGCGYTLQCDIYILNHQRAAPNVHSTLYNLLDVS